MLLLHAPISLGEFAEDIVSRGEPYQIQPRFQSGGKINPLHFTQAGVSHEAFDYLKQCQETFSKYVGDRDQPIQNIILADFSECMEQPRLFVVKYNRKHPEKSTVELRTWVSHGSGSGRVNPKEKEWACTTSRKLSDGKATQQTPAGCMRVFGKGVSGFMPSFPKLRGFYVSGLEEMNECSYTKGIRIHNYPDFENPVEIPERRKNQYSARAEIRDTHRIQRVTNSAGCMRVDDDEIDHLKPYINAQEGTLLVNYPGLNVTSREPRTIVPRPRLDKYVGSPMKFEADGNRKRRCVEGERAPVVTVYPNENTVLRRWFTGTTVTPAKDVKPAR